MNTSNEHQKTESSPKKSHGNQDRDRPRPRVDTRFFIKIALQIVGAFAVGAGLLFTLAAMQRAGYLTVAHDHDETATESDQIYTCPMHPQIRQPNPGRCPICAMALEPAGSNAGSQDEFAVRIEPAARRLANIQSAAVQSRPVSQTIQSVGRLATDESRLATIAAYVPGRIERLFADYTGVEVSRGDHLAVLYSPRLYSAQVEYLESKESLEEMGDAALPAVQRAQQRLVENSRQRLVEFGMTEEQISRIEETLRAEARLTIYAPIGGTVVEKPVVEGKYVDVGEPIYRIANLSTVWLMLEMYPEDAAKIRYGQAVEAMLQSSPGKTWVGRVAFIQPTVDERTRTVAVRVEMDNSSRLLRPGDYASARIQIPLGEGETVYDADLAGKWISPMHPQIIRDEPGDCPICGMKLQPTSRYGFSDVPTPQPNVLVVPRNAVLMGGGHSLVYVETEPGRFEIRPIRLGPILRDEIVVMEGVDEGEMVATSGNFLIDSQMQLTGNPSLIDPTRAIERQAEPEYPNEPLELETDDRLRLTGEAGEQIERLYDAYFAIQTTFADDKTPSDEQVQELLDAGQMLQDANESPDEVGKRLEPILENAAHLHHQSLDDARVSFKPVSHNVLALAAKYRGEQAEQTYTHFFCSMVDGGGGDWLQREGQALNPYWGSKMLHCAQHEEKLPLPEESATTEKTEYPNEPLELDSDDRLRLTGEAGEQIERLYDAYFAIQTTFADDKTPSDEQVQALLDAGQKLQDANESPDEVGKRLEPILENAAHLHHQSLDDARVSFKPVSHNVLALAAKYRGEKAEQAYTHFFCSMVDGGGGDWLQREGQALNPYWGSKMLHCAQHEEKLPLPGDEDREE